MLTKSAKTFNKNLEASEEHLANFLKHGGLTTLKAVKEFRELTIMFPNDPVDPGYVMATTTWTRKYKQVNKK